VVMYVLDAAKLTVQSDNGTNFLDTISFGSSWGANRSDLTREHLWSYNVTMSTQPKSIPAGEFKARCLALLDKVARTRQPLIVTKRGKPVAKVVPTETHKPRKLLGSVKFHGNIVDPILDQWEI